MKRKEKHLARKPRQFKTLWNHKRMFKKYMHITVGMNQGNKKLDK
jgi:hypothetical protein